MLSKAKKGSHIRTRDNMGFEMKRLRFKCPPKNWETRSWSGDGRRPSGALHATGVASWLTRSSLRLSSSSSSSLKVCGSLGLGGACLLDC
ncbi:unnamed protein product [Microthlaspi erraticum]|uniref:Uncharacterized protein n=1 Tax=Microthlaspi erraticum TaxID=1685480 RepID=A0A6D2KYX5_9BRAS|nr:unnamed protein product [Microthlaspi erraticum]